MTRPVLSPSVLPRFVPSAPALFGPVRSAAQWLAGVPAALPVVGPLLRPRTPRLWRTPGGVQIEVLRLGRPGTAGAAREVETTLREMPGVYRAEVNGTLGCVYVGCGPEADLERVVALVAAADAGAPEAGTDREGEPGAGARRVRRPVGFPGAAGPGIEAAVHLGAGLAAVGAASVGNVLRLRGLHPLVISAVQLVEATPRLREGLAGRIGDQAAERTWAAANVLLTTLTFRPLGAATTAVLAGARYAEVRARRTAWREWARRLAAHEGTYRHDAVPTHERPAPLPPGPGERYANVAVPVSVAAYGLTTVGRLGHDRGMALLTAGTPRGPRLGRESFVCSVARAVSERGALVLRPEALRRLDRIDTVVLDARVLATGGWTVEHLVRLTPPGGRPGGAGAGPDGERRPDDAEDGAHDGAQEGPDDGPDDCPDEDEIHARIHELIEPGGPGRRPRHGGPPGSMQRSGWALRPYTGPDTVPGGVAVSEETAAQAARWAEEGAQVLLVLREGSPVAVTGLTPQLHALAHHLVRAARECGEVRLVGGPPGLHRRFGLPAAVPTGHRRTAALVRSLQAQGHGVAVVSARTRRALARADLGIGVLTGPRHVPWDAHVAAPPDVVHLLLTALPEARRVGTLCTRMEGAGALTGSGLALFVPRPGAWARARLVTDAVTIAGITVGFWAGRRLRARPAPAAIERTPWHSMTVRQVMARLGTTSRGLDEAEAARRRQFEGRDRHDGAVGLIGRFAEEMANPLTPVLAIGGGISAALGSVMDAVLIGGVLGVDALVGGVQQQKADHAARRLVEATSVRVRVRRADRDEAVEAAAEDLVRGDVIELRAGDAVPADCRVVRAQGVEADESSLTGESLPVLKTAAPSAARAVADRTSMLYQGTTVAAGHALAVVVATGTATEAGGAAEAGPLEGPPESGVERRLKGLGRWFLPMSVAAGAALFAVDVLRRRPLGAALGSAVSLCVAAVPEGLPFVATVAELAAARRLSTRNTLVRSTSTIEALGRTDVLCFDKTGTLTEGRISLQQVSDGLERRPPDRLTPALRRVLATAVLAGPTGPAASLAHPTDRAIAAGAELLGAAPARAAGLASATWDRVTELPFEPGRGFHAVLGRSDDRARIVVKGAPEVVLARCDRIRRGAGSEPFGDRRREEIEAEVDRLARQGLRVLAVAERVLPPDAPRDDTALADLADVSDENLDGLCLLGLLGLADPVRATAAESVHRLAEAGVRIVMVTGDHPSTAAAIARELRPEEEPRLMTGTELDSLDDAALAKTLPDITVFARVTPAHKVRIVTALRAAGRIVAVTGDGANDAPAIRIADVGIALGSRATPAARSAADVVVTDDRIETIVDAIVEGRAMWASVRKALGILLGGNVGEIIFTLATSLLTGRSALNARQLLLVNLLTDMLPAMAIAARPPAAHPGKLLAEGPEASLGAALTRHIRLRAVVTTAAATAAWVAARATGTRGRADTVALVALVSSQLFQTLADAGRDPVVAAAVVGSLVVLGVVVTVPGLSHFFGSRPLGPAGWTIALTSAVGSVVLPAMAQFAARAGRAGGHIVPERESSPSGHLGAASRKR
ncbi:cation-translocating P-type ATPase [Streptomyces sp. NL15-2K]|uniref:cation-translocating P-type ATPase n=1 Tax=Streptomyces sp. NL15-2K TaxID=376149 RepID=UPI000F56F2D9|nr:MULTISPECIES: cation-translocating P-type ATPase [Actinomycetes]WKX08838.1 cation-translocating P-type ATPase [Kutzneria buriramensis]GCB49673.1 FUPA24 P-type ATPase [Streptomyces sp. NL15-2K]